MANFLKEVNGAPRGTAMVVADLPTGIPNANLATMANNTVKANISGGSAVPSDVSAVSTNTASSFVVRDSSGNFAAGTITAALSGNATTATTATSFSGSLSGDVTGTQSATTIAANAVTNAKFRQSNGLSVVGNSTNATANVADITGTTDQVLRVSSAGTTLGFGAINLASASAVTGTLANGNTTATNNATASTIMSRDANINSRINSIIQGFTTTATAAGTTTLTVSSTWAQQFTGSTTQTVTLPDATTLVAGQSFFIMNRSTGVVTVNANGGGLIQTMAASSQTMVTVTAVGTSAGSWDSAYSTTTSSGSTNPTTNGTRASPNSIVAGTGLSSSFVSTTALVQVVFVQGSGGAVTITATPAIVAGTIVGQLLYIIGRTNANPLTIPNQSGSVELNGPCSLGLSDMLTVLWDGTAWVEQSRNN